MVYLMLTCAVMQSSGIDVSPSVEEDLRYLGGADVAGPEEGGPGAGVPLLQAGALLHQQPAAVRPSLPGRVVEGRAALLVLQLDVRPVLDEGEGGLDLALDGGVYEGGPAGLVHLVDLDVDVEKES